MQVNSCCSTRPPRSDAVTSRVAIPGTNRIIYVIGQDESEMTCDIRVLEEILDDTVEQINIIRSALDIIKNEHFNSDEPSQLT